jgi:hypothetical protein
MKSFNVIFMLMTFLFIACERDTSPSAPSAGMPIVSYGTSFGECIGYCNRQVVLSKGLAVFTKSGWLPDEALPDVQLAEELPASEWSSILQAIDWDEFQQQPERIGCPDCADGGAEWIEIEYETDVKKRVTFEYGKSIKGHEKLLEHLRVIFQRMNEKLQ